MNDWDAPTGSWDPGEEPAKPGWSQEQGYPRSEPAGGRHGDRARRAGRRALPGYDEAQRGEPGPDYDPAAGYGQPPGYGQQPAYDQAYYGQAPAPGYGPAYDQPPGYGQPPAYGQPPGYDPAPAYDQPPGYGQPPAYQQMAGYSQHPAYDQGSGYPQDGYAPDGYAPDGLVEDDSPRPGYGGFEPRGPGRREGRGRGRRQRARRAQNRTRTFLYLAGSVLGVVLIVILVIHLTKSGGGNSASAASTPSADVPSEGAVTTAAYRLTTPARIGKFPLNRVATADLKAVGQAPTLRSTLVAQLAARRAGHATKSVFAAYDLSRVTTVQSRSFRAIVFAGFDGTFSPQKVIAYEETKLTSARLVNPGPHGGLMVCGYDGSAGAPASKCVWASSTTVGEVSFVSSLYPAKQAGAAALALAVRDKAEIPAG